MDGEVTVYAMAEYMDPKTPNNKAAAESGWRILDRWRKSRPQRTRYKGVSEFTNSIKLFY